MLLLHRLVTLYGGMHGGFYLPVSVKDQVLLKLSEENMRTICRFIFTDYTHIPEGGNKEQGTANDWTYSMNPIVYRACGIF